MNVAQARARRAEIAAEMRTIHETANGPLDDAAQTKWNVLDAEIRSLTGLEQRAAQLDELDRRTVGNPVAGTGDTQFDQMVESVGLLDVIRAGMGGTDAASGRARELSQELERRSGRKAQGTLFSMRAPLEQRVLTTTAPVAGPGSSIIGTDYRPDMFIDRLRNATQVRRLGATVLTNLVGNVVIPRRKASVAMGWVSENQPFPVSDPAFDGITLTPKHAGAISEWSRNMILQASPDVEQLARSDMAMQLAEVLDAAAIAGTGANAQPTGILNTPGISLVSAGTNGGSLDYNMIADLIGAVNDANADGSSTGFLSNTKVRRYLSKMKDSTGTPLGLDVLLQGKTAAFSNLVPSTGTKGTGTGLSSLIYGNWSELFIGVFSELDILVNPYESTAYSKGNVQIRAVMSVDIAVRHASSFAAFTDLIA